MALAQSFKWLLLSLSISHAAPRLLYFPEHAAAILAGSEVPRGRRLLARAQDSRNVNPGRMAT